jgi:heptosyltransferase-2
MNRILVIRGGAIGDFVLTLPAIKLLRDRFPNAHLEILGYKHIAALADKRFYADAVRSIESAALARFFAKDSQLPGELLAYFGGFDLVLSYLYDPDAIFQTNVKKSRTGMFLTGPSKLDDSEHAAFQLARPLAPLGLRLTHAGARLFPNEDDWSTANRLFPKARETVTFHPGSGSETKNWPIENWIELGNAIVATGHDLLIIGGEADFGRTQRLRDEWKEKPVRFAENLPLPHLAALVEDGIFIGHDSGISHIAAAVDARCILLFGPTNPSTWAPANANVTALFAPGRKLELLGVEPVAAALSAALGSHALSAKPPTASDTDALQ